MSCYRPLTAYQDLSGGLHFGAPPASGYSATVKLPCGQCIGCRIDKRDEWAMRMAHEARLHDVTMFVTLTYHDNHLPYGGTLEKAHVQAFLKRLRQYLRRTFGKDKKIRYFFTGEYGDTFKRPHYHAIIFGWWPGDAKLFSGGKLPLWNSEKLTALWGHGYVTFGEATPASMRYCAQYTTKKIGGELAKQHYSVVTEFGEMIQREPEFSLKSTNPGLGAGYFKKYRSDVESGDFCLLGGRKLKVPRYYDKLKSKEDADAVKKLKAKRKRKAQKHAANNTPARLATREAVAKAKAKFNAERKSLAS